MSQVGILQQKERGKMMKLNKQVCFSNKKVCFSNKKPDVRFLYDAKKVLYDQKWVKKMPDIELYYMYRGLKRKGDLRCDITAIPPMVLGKEFVKTIGHEHKNNFAELYIVLEGKAIYLAQKRDAKGGLIDVFAVEASKGEAVIVPNGYGHVTVNPGQKKLIMANWISEKCINEYDIFSKKRGACYYCIKGSGKKKYKWIKNKSYKTIPNLRFEKSLKQIPKNLDFLKKNQ